MHSASLILSPGPCPPDNTHIASSCSVRYSYAASNLSINIRLARYLHSIATRTPSNVKFHLANGLALSLEFKMAAEILKTVLVRSVQELVILGAVVLLRALLSLLIHFEMKEEHDHPLHTYPKKQTKE